MSVLAKIVAIFALSICAQVGAGDLNVRAMFELAVKEVGNRGPVPVYVPTVLSKEIPLLEGMVVRGKEAEFGYDLTLYFEEGIGDAGFAAAFSGSTALLKLPSDLPGVLPVKLRTGTSAWFRPVSCGGSCAPANLWWQRGSVQYQIQLKLRSDLSEGRQLSAMLDVANSMSPSQQP